MLEIIGIFLIILGLLLIFWSFLFSKHNNNFPKIKRKELQTFCILIPARDESKVIEDLLISIKKQTFKVSFKDVIIIVESKDDPTCDIAKKYGATIFVRKELHLKRKGYALNEVITDLSNKNIFYDAYFIIDADNVLDERFIEKLNKSYMQGYDIAIGYRNLKNGNDSVISASSGITFSLINTNGNEVKSMQSRNVTLSGTGLYIAGELVRKWQCFPFCSLTEDYELTLYSILNNLTSTYNKKAIFYDEQPIKYKDTINQRMRWIKGYFMSRKEYIPKFRKVLKNNPNFGSIISEIIGVKPYILMIIGVILYIINQIINIFIFDFNESVIRISCFKILLIIVLAYILFCTITFYTIKRDNKMLNLTNTMKIKTILFSPIFFLTYVPCAIKALLKKDLGWDKVEHNRNWNDIEKRN